MADELRDILRNRVKEKLARDEVVASMTVRLCRSIEIARIAATAGFDTIYVDVEHNTLSIDAVCQICIAAMQCGITPLVRVPANTPEFISRLLDGGAMGVIAPHVRTAEEAREIVRYAKFTPQGERGAGGALPHYHYRSFPSAMVNQAMNDATMVVVMMHQRSVQRNGHHGAVRSCQCARCVLAYDRGVPEAREARRGRRAGVAAGPDGGVCAAGSAICVHRDGPVVPACGSGGEGEVRAGDIRRLSGAHRSKSRRPASGRRSTSARARR
jgi:hypothetical protein